NDILRRELAPLSTEVWEIVDSEVREALTVLLSARRVVDFAGPHGYTKAAVSTGRLVNMQQGEGFTYATRAVLPMTELRVDFRLSLGELDNHQRNAVGVDLSAT